MSGEAKTKLNTGDLFFVRASVLAQTPESLRAWSTIAASGLLLSLILLTPLTLFILFRLGWDAVRLPAPEYQEFARNFVLTGIGLFGAPFLVWRTWVAHQQARAASEQARIALENHITGIFSKSIELLGNVRDIKTIAHDGGAILRSAPNTESRLGALYSLERLLNESEKDQRAILETLCAYVRENSPLEIPTDDDELKEFYRGNLPPTPSKRSDVQAAITIIGRRSSQLQDRGKNEGWTLDFKGTNLILYDFSGLNFDQSNFSNSFLNAAILTGGSFINSTFSNTFLRSADLTGADLSSGCFVSCDVSKAKITNTNFNSSRIKKTDLREANVHSFSIKNADLQDAFSESFLQYALEDAKKNGSSSFSWREIFDTAVLFQKATFNDETTFSQAVSDALWLVKSHFDSHKKSEQT